MTQRLDIDQPFDLNAVLDGTQDFRWRPWECDWHSGVLNGNLIHIRQVSGGVEYRAAAELDALVRSYFRLDDNIPAMRAELSARDRNVARLLNKYPHLRVLRQQDPWECMVSYICSATNNVSRISAIVESIAETLGQPLELADEVRHTFPTPDMVLEAGVETVTGARHLGKSLEDRKEIRRSLGDFYGLASKVIHGGTPAKAASVLLVDKAATLCRDGILKIVEERSQPDWTELLLS